MDEPPTDRVRVRRLPSAGVYDRRVINEILDAGFVCHMGFVADNQPYVIPTLYGREKDTLVVHGSSASRALRASGAGDICVTVTHLDGLVLARSLFNHTANYRSVVVLGEATEVRDPAAKEHWLRVLTEHVLPGRWQEARGPSRKELTATKLLLVD